MKKIISVIMRIWRGGENVESRSFERLLLEDRLNHSVDQLLQSVKEEEKAFAVAAEARRKEIVAHSELRCALAEVIQRLETS